MRSLSAATATSVVIVLIVTTIAIVQTPRHAAAFPIQDDAAEIAPDDANDAQDPAASDRSRIEALSTEVGTLKERVAILERLLLTQIIEAEPSDIDYLNSSIELANERLAHSQRLFDKGFISELELSRDRFSVERANLRLELASMAADQAEFAASIQLFEAQVSLDLALQRLEHSERLAARGYITPAQLRADQLDVERTRARVNSIQERLHGNQNEEDD